jgi:hypothetical protein
MVGTLFQLLTTLLIWLMLTFLLSNERSARLLSACSCGAAQRNIFCVELCHQSVRGFLMLRTNLAAQMKWENEDNEIQGK